jgi:hypothetical protein
MKRKRETSPLWRDRDDVEAVGFKQNFDSCQALRPTALRPSSVGHVVHDGVAGTVKVCGRWLNDYLLWTNRVLSRRGRERACQPLVGTGAVGVHPWMLKWMPLR